ncbi:MAG: hypothetical protein ABIP35_03795, partial [Ginsengibacter sp.]
MQSQDINHTARGLQPSVIAMHKNSTIQKSFFPKTLKTYSLFPLYSVCISILLVFIFASTHGQSISGSVLLSKQSITNLKQPSQMPRQQKFQEVSTTPVIITNYNPILGNNFIEQQNGIILQQQGMLPGPNSRQKEIELIKQEIKEDERKALHAQRLAMIKPFQKSLQEFLKLNPDSFSISKAIYLTESAWYEKPPTYQQFEKGIKLRAELVKQILSKEGIKSNSNTAKN